MARSSSGTSLVEQTLFYYVRKFFPDAINRHKFQCGKASVEIDIYIPSVRLAIEYDGSYWHKSKRKSDEQKNSLLNAEGVYIVRVRENGLDELSPFHGVAINLPHGHHDEKEQFDYVNKTLEVIFKYAFDLGKRTETTKFELTESRYRSDLPAIYSLLYSTPVSPNLSDLCGAEYWNEQKNNPLKIENLPQDEWSYAFFKCPDGKDIFLPQYHNRIFKANCKSQNKLCTKCLYGIMCPFLYSCKRQDEPVHCQYLYRKIVFAIEHGFTFYNNYPGEDAFRSWLFDESDCGMKIIKLFLDSPPDSEIRRNILYFLGMLKASGERKCISTEFPAWTVEDIELLKRFREQISGIRIRIKDRTDDKPGQRRTTPYVYL